MLVHVARTGCLHFKTYTVTPRAFQFPENADATDRSLSGGSDLSGSAHESALSAAGRIIAALLMEPRTARQKNFH